MLEIEFGDWSGRSFAELDGDPAWRRFNERREDARPPGGETMMEAQRRIVGAMASLRERHPDATVAVVTHGDLIRAALLDVLGWPIGQYRRLEIRPAAVARVTMEADGRRRAAYRARTASASVAST